MPKFGAASLKQLETCDSRLQKVFHEVIKHWDCQIVEGRRTAAQQAINIASGASRTSNSKHVVPKGQLSKAADVAPYPIKWNDIPRFYAFAGFVIGTALQMGIQLRWGGDWDSDRDFRDQTFNDLVHFELVKP